MINKLLCFFNIHDWEYSYINGWIVSKECTKCNKQILYYKDINNK